MRLPEGAAGHRADRRKGVGRAAVGVERAAVAVDVDAEPAGVGADPAGGEQGIRAAARRRGRCRARDPSSRRSGARAAVPTWSAAARPPADDRARRRRGFGRQIRPAAKRSRPSACIASIRSATAGAMRWRWTSHQGRRWRTKRRRSSSGRSPQTCWVTGRSSCTASRQPISRARGGGRRGAGRRSGAGNRPGPSTTGSRRRCGRGARPRRETARIRPRKPVASRVSAASIAVSAVPTSSTCRRPSSPR